MGQVDRLEEWLAQEREVQARLDAGAGCGVATPQQAAGRAGLELLQAMLRGELPYPPIARTLDFQLLEVGEGRAVFQGTPGPAHLNPMGGIHGGWYATLLDSALGCAVHSKMPPMGLRCAGPGVPWNTARPSSTSTSWKSSAVSYTHLTLPTKA